MDGALLAAIFAGLAAIFAGWSAWSSHRSAQLAAEAVKLERYRHHHELAPRIELQHDGLIGGLGEEEGIWFTNRGPLDYTAVEFSFADEAEDSPIAGLQLESGQYVIDGDIGPLAIGQRYYTPLRRHAEDEGAGTLYLTLTCRNPEGAWTTSAQVEIPGVPQIHGSLME